jgi:hypothetical protein
MLKRALKPNSSDIVGLGTFLIGIGLVVYYFLTHYR